MSTYDTKRLCGRVVAALAVCFLSTNASASLPSGTVLQFNPGIAVCDTSGTYPNCDGDGTWHVASGSYFFVDTNNNGNTEGYEKTPISMHDGIILGTSQPAAGSHSGVPDGSETPGIDQPWSFFMNTGMHQTTFPVTDNGDGTLDFSGWGATWNGIPNIHVGDPANYPADTHRATIVCSHNPCQVGDSYMLDYRGHVPLGDPSGFGGVLIGAHLEGMVGNGNAVPRISLQVNGGQIQECSAHGGSPITMTATVTVPQGETLASLNWTIDGNPAGSGPQITPLVPVGTHTVRVEALTTTGHSAVATANVMVRDTISPTVTAAFIDQRTGQAVNQTSKNAKLVIKAEAIDVCDPKPAVVSMAGLPVSNGELIKARVEQQRLIIDDATQITLSVTATDASGNSANGQASLAIVP